jgi:hypothetical protein
VGSGGGSHAEHANGGLQRLVIVVERYVELVSSLPGAEALLHVAQPTLPSDQ